MRILVNCYEDLSGYSGSNKQVIELIGALSRRGHQVLLCAPSIGRRKRYEDLEIKYIPVIDLPVVRFLSYLSVSFLFFLVTCLKFKPDACFVFETYLDLGQLLALKVMRVPFAFYINGIAREEMGLEGKSSAVIWLIERAQKLFVRHARTICVVASGLAEYVSRQYGIRKDKFRVLNDGVDAEDFKPQDMKQARDLAGLEAGVPVVGFLGSLCPWHGLDYLIRSVPEILKEEPRARFIIAGMGTMFERLRGLAAELGLEKEIIFTGQVTFEQAPVYVNAFDIGVIFFKPVRTDPGDPIKMYEYMACGKPVVASNVSGYGDLVERIGAGVSVDAANPVLLARAIVGLLRDAPARIRMGGNGRLAAERYFTWDCRAQELERNLKEIAAK